MAITLLLTPKTPENPIATQKNTNYKKIISLAPNITEILYALGLGDNVIGVSQYCSYPQEATTKKRFGGLMNINYEDIVAAEPDAVIVFDEMLVPENKFAALNINTIVVKHDSIEDIIESILTIGEKCGAKKQAEMLAAKLQSKIQTIKNANNQKKRQKVLLVIGHTISPNKNKKLENIYIAGNDGFYNSMIKIAGAENAYNGNTAFPKIGYENLIAMNPDVIIDATAVEKKRNIKNDVFIAQWKNFTNVKAVKNDRVYVINEKYMTIPGPRFIVTLEKIADAINSENQDDNKKSINGKTQ